MRGVPRNMLGLGAPSEDELIAPATISAEVSPKNVQTARAAKVDHLLWVCDLEWIAANPVDRVPPRVHAAGSGV
jgi:hypothetical protein